MTNRSRRDLAHDLILPTLLFAALGAMSWAVRGSRGYGGSAGCIFAGVLWGAAWWFIARDPSDRQSRRYASGWIILALTIGIGIAGARGWRQWSTFFDGQLQTNTSKGEFVPISPIYGFIWLFIAGMPWAGLGACLLAWCGSQQPTRAWQWSLRIACGFGMAYLALNLFHRYPEVFLPLYNSMKSQYADLTANPNLGRLINDNRNAVMHLGFYLGFLFFEVGRRDWKNVKLMLTVGVVAGLGWSLCQNWMWAKRVWSGAGTSPWLGHWWRSWESCGGISIGIAYGIAYYLVNRKVSNAEIALQETRATTGPSNLNRTGGIVVMSCAGLLLMLTLVWFLWNERSGILSGDWQSNMDKISFAIALAYGIACIACYIVVRTISKAETAKRPAIGRPNLEWWLTFGLMLVLGWFMASQLQPRGLGRGGWWSRLDYMYFAVAAVYGIAYCLYYRLFRLVNRELSEADRAARLANAHRNLDWLTTFLSLLLVAGFFLRGDLRGWSGWFVAGKSTHWYGYLYLAVLAAFAIIYYVVNLRKSGGRLDSEVSQRENEDPHLERLGAYLGLLLGIGLSIKNGLRGVAIIHAKSFPEGENYWTEAFWRVIGPLMLVGLVMLLAWRLFRPISRGLQGDVFPHAYGLMWLVLITQNVLAQFVTGPWTDWREVIFSIYYAMLFILSAVILSHYQSMKKFQW